MKFRRRGQDFVFFDIECFSLPLTLSCGQTFRWSRSGERWYGVAKNRALSVSQTGSELVFHDLREADLPFWIEYFDLETDYTHIIDAFSPDKTLREACNAFCGIRILRQDPFETLCSFIFSSNNNIPRIAGMIDRLCLLCGERVVEYDAYAFPTPERLAALSVEALAPVRAGYRAKYLLAAANSVLKGETDLEKIRTLPLKEAHAALTAIPGVGPKVADCVLLYGYHRLEALPKDVWVNRILSETYPQGLPACVKGYEGIAQQYLFHWRRNI